MLKGVLQFGLTRRPIILLFLLVFIGGGLIAFTRLNIEAYPNPAPVILEITAQAAGLSAEEMERYYTIPMEVGLAATPGVDNIRSTSFYGLSFVRVTFNYGVDYYFALTQAAISLQQNVNLPNNVTPQIQGSSLVGEIYRYQVVGPPHFGLTNLRTIQDWVLQRRLLTVPGVVQVNTWGGTTKEFEVEVDLNKLDAYNVTLPQVINAIGNANINVGGRTINFGQQSVNIRGIGLLNDGGDSDLTQGYRVGDIEKIVLAQSNGVPVKVKDVAKVYVGHVPRLGKAGRDNEDDVVAAIVVMNRTLHTNDVVARIKEEVAEDQQRWHAAARGEARSILRPHNAGVGHHPHGPAQSHLWLPAGLLRAVDFPRRSAQRHHCRRQHSVCAVLQHHHSGVARRGRKSAVGRRRRFRHHRRCRRDPGRKYLSGTSRRGRKRGRRCLGNLRRKVGHRSDTSTETSDTARMDRPAAAHSGQRPAGRQGGVLLHRDHVAAFIPLFTMQGVEGQIFGPMARTYAYALVGALIATFTVTPCWRRYLLPEHVEEVETIVVRGCARSTRRCCTGRCHRKIMVAIGLVLLAFGGFIGSRLGSEFLPALEEGNLWIRASMPPTISLEAGMPIVDRIREILLRHPEVITVVSQHGRPDNGSDAAGFFNAEFFVPLKPFDEWPLGHDQGQADRRAAGGVCQGVRRHRLQFLAVHPGQCRGRPVGRQRRQFGQDHRPRLGDAGAARRAGHARDGAGPGHHRSRRLSGCSGSPI